MLLTNGAAMKQGGFTRTRFDTLDDTFNYTGKADLFVVVNSSATGLTATSLPPLAITDTFVVNSESAMLALTAQVGDVAVRTDVNQTYILQVADPSILSHWVMLLVSPTHAIGGALHTSDTVANINTKISDGSLITSRAGEISATTAKAIPTTSDYLLIEDAADSNKKKSITIGNLPAPAPASHALAGALHSSDTITNLNTKLTDGSLITSKSGEINALTSKGTPTTSDLLVIEDAAASNAKKKITIGTLPAAAPAAHALAGALHSSDTITNLNSKLTDGALMSSKTNEINQLTAKTSPTTSDIVVIEDAAASYAKKKVTLSNLLATSGTLIDRYSFTMPQQASATLGKFMKAAQNNNGGMLYTTDQANAGIQNGQIDPYVASRAGTITRFTITFASCAVSQGTVGAGPVNMTIDVYRNDYSTRTLLGSITVPIDRTKCGVNNALGGNNFQTVTVTGLSISLTQGDTWGIQFTNVSTNNNCINALQSAYATVEVTE